MLKGLTWFITLDNGIIQMIDFWTYIHEFGERDGKPLYDSRVYNEAYT